MSTARGRDVVLLAHSAVFDKESWKPLDETLVATGHRVMAIDFRARRIDRWPRGHGVGQ
jgi:hypothetical protein